MDRKQVFDSLSVSHSLKREMRSVGEDCSLQPVTIAMAFVYFEKLVLQGRLNKQNRYSHLPPPHTHTPCHFTLNMNKSGQRAEQGVLSIHASQ